MAGMNSKLSGVVPVIDYEPPVFGGPPAPPAPARVRARPRPVAPAARPGGDAEAHAAARFADAALRRVLEVIDHRRPPAQLRPLLAGGLAESLLQATGRRSAHTGAARLRRVLARPVARDTAEVAASYVRGDRVGAIACRVEQVCTPTGPRWQVVALHIG